MVIKAGSHTLEKWTTTTKKNPRASSVKKQIRRKGRIQNANYRETPNYDRKLKGL